MVNVYTASSGRKGFLKFARTKHPPHMKKTQRVPDGDYKFGHIGQIMIAVCGWALQYGPDVLILDVIYDL